MTPVLDSLERWSGLAILSAVTLLAVMAMADAGTTDWSPPELAVAVGIVPPAVMPGQTARVGAVIQADMERKCSAAVVASVTDSRGKRHLVTMESMAGYSRHAMFRDGFGGPVVHFEFAVPLQADPGEAYYTRETEFDCGAPRWLKILRGWIYGADASEIRSVWSSRFTILPADR